jgi:hypothetical protein
LLGYDPKHLSTAEAKQLKLLTKILQHEVQVHYPEQNLKYLRVGQQLLTSDNIRDAMDELNREMNATMPTVRGPATGAQAIRI